ncbi:MAG TPA: CpXC domain-containing protein [Anaerolineales bacterium]|nr:CpXC domain-containing protein [Anaerolineales bacterium]
MPRTQVNCPNCRQPTVADIDQLFDVGEDPTARQRLLSGSFNLIQCPNCGFQGNAATPLVYHDPEKELLLTFVPPEIGLPRNEQERLIGSIINQVVNRLPQEQRKGYLLRPQETLTLQGLIERVLEAEGMTREMIEAQQKKLNLIQQLANASDEAITELAEQQDALIDAEFFALLRRLVEASAMAGDENSARRLAQIQSLLLPVTTFGREMQAQSQEIEQAMSDLRAAGEGLSREHLLELIVDAPNETRRGALVSMARQAMDYQFFQLVSERIEAAQGEDKTRLLNLREQLLEMTREIDRQIEARVNEARDVIEQIVNAPDVAGTMQQALQVVDEFFVQELNAALEQSRQQGDLERSAKLRQMVDVIQSASAPPPEIAFLETLLEAPDEESQRQLLKERQEEITPEFLSTLAGLVAQVESSEDPQLVEQLKRINRLALRLSMEKNLRAQ